MRAGVLLLLLVVHAAALMQGAQSSVAGGAKRLELPLISAEMAKRHQMRVAALKPAVRSWAEAQAKSEEKRGKLDVNGLQAAVRQRFAGANKNAVAEMTVVLLMMMVQDEDKDLQQKMQEAQQQMAQKQALRQSLTEMNTAMASALGTAKSEPVKGACVTAFCKSVPGKVKEINAAAGKLKPESFRKNFKPHLSYAGVVEQQGRVQLDQDTVSYEQLRDLKLKVTEMLGALTSDADMNAELQNEVQLAQQTYTQAEQLESNNMKAFGETGTGMLANLK
jgi:hypothetical protein